MKANKNTLGLLTKAIVLALVFALALAGCKNPAGEDGGGEQEQEQGLDLDGVVTIDPAGPVLIDTELTAYYDGSETVSYQWKKDGGAISGENGTTYMPTSAGSYTVTVSAEGYKSQTSTAVTVLPPGSEIPLTAGKWTYGAVSAENNAIGYTFNVALGTTYYVWWNDDGQGDNTQTGDIKVTATYSDGTSIFSNADSAYNTARSFTATKNDTVKLKVEPYSSSYYGTYGIVCTLVNTKPLIIPAHVTPLAADVWADGFMPTTNVTDWYSFPVDEGTTYNVWLNDNNYGDNSKTVRTQTRAYYGDGISISAFPGSGNTWTTARTFTAASSGTVYILVSKPSMYTSSTGTYSIVYSTSETRPFVFSGVEALPLTQKIWTEGEVHSPHNVIWYSFPIVSGTAHRIWWNDSKAGDNTKEGDILVSAWYGSTGAVVVNNADSGWTSTTAFTPTADDTVYVRVTPYADYAGAITAGDYAITWTTTNYKPLNLPPAVEIVSLIADVWKDSEITDASETQWYKFDATQGTGYRYWWNDSYEGNGTKTGDVQVSSWYADGAPARGVQNSGWKDPQTISSATSTGTIYLRVELYYGTPGTYSIVYSEGASATRPAAPYTVTTTPLTAANVFVDGSFTNAIDVTWYTLDVTASTDYYLWWNAKRIESGYYDSAGDGTKTGDVSVSVYRSSGDAVPYNFDPFVNQSSAWDSGKNVKLTSDDKLYIKVTPSSYSGANIGTYAILYTLFNARPVDKENTTFIPLVADTWVWSGEWPASGPDVRREPQWFSMDVTSANTYRVWWSTSSSEGAVGASVTFFTPDGNPIPDFVRIGEGGGNPAWLTPVTLPAGLNGKVYIKAEPWGGAGRLPIVYSTGTTRPVGP